MRHNAIQKMMLVNTEYKPPPDYKAPQIKVMRSHDKVMIPQDNHPDINFVGLLIGPRGNTLKNIEKDTGAKIFIRGKERKNVSRHDLGGRSAISAFASPTTTSFSR